MKVALCLTRFENEWVSLKTVLDQLASVALIQSSIQDMLASMSPLEPDVYLIDSRTPRSEIEMLQGLVSPTATIVLVTPVRNAETHPDPVDTTAISDVYDVINLGDSPADLRRSLQRALERSELVKVDDRRVERPFLPAHVPVSLHAPERPWEMALRSLSRTLSAGFDTQAVIEPFLDLVVELAGLARVSILTVDPGGTCFKVSASRGLHSPVLLACAHSRQSKLVEWLIREGRPLRSNDASITQSGDPAIPRAFDALQACVCIPMASMGELVGFLALGSRINGHPPTDEQVEMLFTVGGHVAVTLQNIRLHHETARQEAQHESVLEHMTNGIAVIDDGGRVAVFNRRAGEILKLSSETLLGADLRALPAPLGDYLYNTLVTGDASRHTALILPGSGIPVEVSTYPLSIPSSNKPVGSVLLLEDISERIALEESRRHADRQDIFTRLISQLAHEIKNPLVAVKTFADLYHGRLDDADFLRFVSATVVPEIFRLDAVVGRLVDFVDQCVLQMQNCNLGDIVREVIEKVQPEASGARVDIVSSIEDPAPEIRADPMLLSKALTYLLRHVVFNMPGNSDAKVRISVVTTTTSPLRALVDITTSHPWMQQDEIDHIFDPLYVRKDQLNLSLPAARKIVAEHRGDMEAIPAEGGKILLRLRLRLADSWPDPASNGPGDIESIVAPIVPVEDNDYPASSAGSEGPSLMASNGYGNGHSAIPAVGAMRRSQDMSTMR